MSTSITTSEDVSLHPRVNKPRMAYIVSLFPCWSETFIAEELQHLLDDRFDISIFSLKPPAEKDVHRLAQGLLQYVIYPNAVGLLAAQFRFAFRKPTVYFGCLWQLISHSRGSLHELARFLATFAIAVYFAGEVEKRHIQRIHAHWATYPATAAWIIHKLLGVPYSFTTHAHDLFLADDLLPRKLNEADFVVTISDFNRKLLESMGGKPEKIHVIHCGVDTGMFRPASGRSAAEPYIFSVGRLVSIKGFDVLVEACHLLKESGVEFHCEIVGEGPLRSELTAQIARHQLAESVHLVGFAQQDEVRKRLERAAIFVLPCRETKSGDRDGIPVAMMEAMAMQVPVVSTAVSGVPELIENERCGLLVASENPAEIANAIADLLRHPAKREALAQAGRAKVLEEFDVANNALTLARLFARPS